MDVIVAGAGPGSGSLLTDAVKIAAMQADWVYTSQHLAPIAKTLNAHVKILSVKETLEAISASANAPGTIVVLAVGDTGFYSIGSTIAKRAPEHVKVTMLPGIGSLQYFCAKTGHSYSNMKLVSLHGRPGSLVAQVCYNPLVFTLTGGTSNAGDLVRELTDAGLGHVKVWIGENLSLADERICQGLASELVEEHFSDLAVMILENEGAVNPNRILRDEEFLRAKVPMTKSAVRNLAAAELAVQPGDVVYDIGAGSGAMTCTLALKAHESMVYAVEQKKEALDLVRKNMEHFGIYNIVLAEGRAPEGMEDWPAPDKVFIGGSSGNLAEIVSVILGKNPLAKILVTAVTMETVSEAFQLFDQPGFTARYQCVNVAESNLLGRYHLMKAENPVYLIYAEPVGSEEELEKNF